MYAPSTVGLGLATLVACALLARGALARLADGPISRTNPPKSSRASFRSPPAALTDGGTREPKLVLAYVRPGRLDDVKEALAEVGAPSLTVSNVSGRGSQPAKKGQWRGEEYTVDLHQKVKVECVVADVPAEDVMRAIADAARTGEKGDGKVFVLPVEAALQIRTGDRGLNAV